MIIIVKNNGSGTVNGTWNQNKKLLFVIPVYKEEKILKKNTLKLMSFLDDNKIDYQIILSIDDSGDGSIEIGKELASMYKNIDLIIHKDKLGRGFAVREAWSKYNCDVYAFIDADLSMNLDAILDGYNTLLHEKADGIIASRYIKGATVIRPQLRMAISKVYNAILRVLFSDGVYDHQCGLKMITREARDSVLNLTHIRSWFWDAELIVIMKSKNLVIKEVPVKWVETKYVKTSIRRLIDDTIIHGYGILFLMREVHNIKKGKMK